MPDIGFLELILVGIIAFLVLGPERMPELFGQVGRVVRKGRGWYSDIRKQIDAETAVLKDPLHEVKDAVGGISDYNAAIMKELSESMSKEPSAKEASYKGASFKEDLPKEESSKEQSSKEQSSKKQSSKKQSSKKQTVVEQASTEQSKQATSSTTDHDKKQA